MKFINLFSRKSSSFLEYKEKKTKLIYDDVILEEPFLKSVETLLRASF